MNIKDITSPRLSSVVLILMLSSLAAGMPAQAPPAPATFTLTVRTAKPSVKPGEPVRVSVTLTNVSKNDISVEHDISNKGELFYSVRIQGGNGKGPRKTQYNQALSGEPTSTPMIITSSPINARVSPGKTLVEVIDLKDLYDLSEPGTYSIQVERTDPYSKTTVSSNKLTIVITPN